MQNLKKAWEWLVKSSANANELSLTVKAFLYGLIPMVVAMSGIMHVQLNSNMLTELVDALGQVIVVVGGIVTGLTFLIALLRKIITTITGKNEVVLGWSDKY